MEIPSIVLAGEPMGLFIAQEEGPLEAVCKFNAAVAGAEFNVAIGLSRLGLPVKYFTKLGDDPFGRRIRETAEENDVDTALVLTSRDHSTGFMLKGKTSRGDPSIHYFRKDSAASMISAEDVKKIDFSGCGILHMTGILPALSETARQAAFTMVQKARRAGMLVFFDPNLRPQLWPSERAMVETVNELAALSDYFLPGDKEGGILAGSTEPEKIAAHYLSTGVKAVVVKTGARGAYAATKKDAFYSPGFRVKKIVDTVGAGDGFAVGVLSGIAEGISLKAAVRRGNAIGALQVMNAGDNEGLPVREELERFMASASLGA